MTAAVLRRLEQWCDPRSRLAAAPRPSHGIARRSRDSDPTPLGWTWVPSGPLGVSTPSGLARGRTSRAGLRRTGAPLVLSLPYRGPSQHPRTVPRARRPTRRTMLPPVDFAASRHMRGGGPVACGASGSAPCHVRGLITPLAASTSVPWSPLRGPSVLRLRPSRRSPRTDRAPFRRL